MDPVASTAHWVAAARARESGRADALFHDPFAAVLAGDEGEQWMTSADADAFISTYVALRTRFFDDELIRAVREGGIRQVVILAAGLDARAYRIDWPAGTRLFEADQPEVIAYKDRILAGAHAAPRCTRRTLGVDLAKPWTTALCAAGFSPEERSAWLVEGLLPYLNEEAVRGLFTQISALSAPGSTLALDCAGTDPFTAPAFATQAAQMRARGIEMRYACDDPVGLLDRFGWTGQGFTVADLAASTGRPLPWAQPDGEDPLRSHLVRAARRPDGV